MKKSFHFLALISINSFFITAQNMAVGDFYLDNQKVSTSYLSTKSYLGNSITLSAIPKDAYSFDSWHFLKKEELLKKKSNWKYLDNGVNLDTIWRNQFDDSSWTNGHGIFGYNNNNETTILNYGNDPNKKHISTYFRKNIQIVDPSTVHFIELGVLVDDGAVVYLNGVEIARVNMPSGKINFQTFASGNIPNETQYYEFTLPASGLLLSGENIIAVEAHQSSFGSSDMSFDAYLNLITSKEYTPPFDPKQNPVTFTANMDELVYPLFKKTPIDSTKYFIHLSEVMSDNDTTIADSYGKNSDWIEIFNSSKDSVSLSGFTLSDKLDNLNKWSFPNVSIGAKQYLLVYASEGVSTKEELHANFKISSSGEPISLSYKGDLLETIPSHPLIADESLINIDGIWQKSSTPTPKKENIGFQKKVIFSKPAGLYPSEFYLQLSGNSESVSIRYTNDGSDPSATSNLYSNPILIKDLTSEPNGIANFKTSGDWKAPSVNLLKGSVIKAAMFQGDTRLGPIETNTYLVNENFPNKYNFPVVSISINADSLFDHEEGLMVLGPNASPNHPHINANFWQNIERKCFVEFFEDNGELAFEQYLGMQIHGGYSKGYAQKSMRLTARDEFGADRVFHKIFPNLEVEEYKSFILRNSGQDINRSFFRDALAQDVNQTEHLDMQAYRPSVVFINGVYWGIHNLRERLDDHHYSIKHDISRKSIDYLEIDGDVVSGGNADYLAMLSFMESNSLAEQKNFDSVATQMDINNFTDYMITQIYVNNHDWPHGNIKFWRSSELDNKWRWVLYDLDPGMGGWAGNADVNNLVRALSVNGNGKGAWATLILRSLMTNEEYKKFFINRFLDRLNTGLKEELVSNRVEYYRSLITPIMSDHIDRWPTAITSMLAWKYGVNPIKTFAERRPTTQRKHLADYFGLENVVFNVSIQNTDHTKGLVRLNSLTIDTSSFTGLYLKGIPVLVEAIPNPGYRFSHWLENANENARLTISLLSDTLLTAVFVETTDFDYSSISINEVYNRNSEAIKGSIEEQEWIEIHNSSDESIDLAGLFLSDNEDLTRWMFPLYSPEKTTVPAQGFISIFGDVNTYFVGLEANFKSIKTNDVISLTKVIGKDTTVISTLTVPDNAKSNGRYPDGSSTLRLFSYPTYVSTNSLYLDCNEDEKGGAIIDACGVCAGGNTQILIDDCVTAIEEDLDFSILTAYPNPVLSDVYLNHNITWLLTDIHGIEIDRGMSSSVDMSRLTNGIYFLKTNLGQIKLLKY